MESLKDISESECVHQKGRMYYTGWMNVPDCNEQWLQLIQICHDTALAGLLAWAITFNYWDRWYY